MSDIIWLVYMADVLPSLSVVLIWAAVLLGLFYIGEWLVYGISEGNHCVNKHHYFIGASFALFLLSAFIPTKQTIYMIGGIEASKQLASTIGNSELASKTMQVLNQELDNIIAKNLPKQETK